MSLRQEDAIQIIYSCLTPINALRAANLQIALAPETKLLGANGELDSLEFVNLVVGLEEHLAERLQRPIVLVNDEAFGEARFRDVATLAAYINDLSKQ